ncbi:MAG: PAS domain S-box protein [Flavobacteriales bacterium]|nr:PAS domain S-box protein [Flavobacteriales bacterium]
MELSETYQSSDRLRLTSIFTGWLAFVLGASVLVGWLLDVEILLRPIPGSVAMNPTTALCFMLCAIGVLRHPSALARWSVGVAFVICAIKLVLWIMDSSFSIDRILFASKLDFDMYRGLNNRMAPNTAIAFVLSSGAMLYYPQSKKGRLPELLALLATVLGTLSLIGYGYRVPEFYGVLKHFPMAVHTAVGFVLLGVAILAFGKDGPLVSTILSKGTGGLIARWLLPLAILLPIGLGAIRLYGERQGIYSSVFGLMLLVVVIIIIFCLIIWRVAAYANQHDLKLKEYADKLAELNTDLEAQVRSRTVALERQTRMLELKLKELTDYKYALDQGTIVAITDQKGIILHVNDNFCRISGYAEEELLGRDHRVINSGHHPKEFMRDLWRTIASGKVWRGIIRNKSKKGGYYWVDTTIIPFLNEEGKPVKYMAIRSDLTDLKDTSQQLADSEARFRYTLDNMMEGAQMIDKEFRYVYLNDAVLKHGKYGREEMVGRTMMECYPGIEQTEVFKLIEKSMGQPEGTNHHIENHFQYPDGTSAWFELSVQRVPEGVFVLSIDVTDRKKAENELRELNRSLEKMVDQRTAQLQASNQELESFSYSVSHDLRAPLRAINGFSEMLEKQYTQTLDDNAKRLLGIIKSNALTMGKLIDDLLEFSRTGRKEVRNSQVSMQEVVENILSDLKQEYPEGGTKITLGKLPVSKCDPQLMRHVWGNLISNAFKYSSKKENPEITIWAEDTENEILYHIKDNGAGFNMEYADKLFGVFQRLHSTSEFQGTGVGLAIVNRIVNKHGGRVWAEAEVGKGATFHFSLPKNPNLNPEYHEQEDSRTAVGGG